jgi:hypothetical protein
MLVVKRSFWGKGVAAKLLAHTTSYIGEDRAVSLSLRNYNDRAKAFFKKHGFADTGETTGNHAIPRTLMLREANEVTETPIMEDKKKAGYADDFPSSANEPVFEALPDYRLATDEAPLFETGENKLSTSAPEDLLFSETTLDEKTLTELEAFIARARALKGASAPADGFQPISPKPKIKPVKPQVTHRKSPVAKATPSAGVAPAYNARNIPFEVDFGNGRVEEANAAQATTSENPAALGGNHPASAKTVKPSFEFAFSATPDSKEISSDSIPPPPTGLKQVSSIARAKEQPPISITPEGERSARKTKECPDCKTNLPHAARFCFSCGYPQPESTDLETDGAKAPEEDFLVLEELPSEASEQAALNAVEKETAKPAAVSEKNETERSARTETKTPKPRVAKSASGAISTKKYTMGELRLAFREHFQERVIAYFGVAKLKKYYKALEESNSFQQLRDGSLTNLLNWINGGERTYADVGRRINDTMADLTEYFIVEVAAELSGSVLPQRLLRHQSVNWDTVNLFKLVMDYLNFEAETERVYTDFVLMPARALRNATKAFLSAGKDERIFFVCDQSLISQAKNGFAITDSGIYWKNVLQPAGNALFVTMESISLGQGHLEIDGQFFNAGARLNLKMAVLLDKLRRMETRN